MKRISARVDDLSFDIIPLIAHDLRTPITAIKGLSQLALRRPDLPEPAVRHLSAVVDEANQMAAIVDDLVLAGRLERGEATALRSKVDLTVPLRGVVDSPGFHGGTARPVVHPSLVSVSAECDPNILTRALVHLLRFVSERVATNDRAAIGATRVPTGIQIWIGPLAATDDTPSQNPVLALNNGGVGDHGVSPDIAAPSLSVFLAAKLIAIMGGQVYWDEPPPHSARFYVVLPEARGSEAN